MTADNKQQQPATPKTRGSCHSKPTVDERSVDDALKSAERRRTDLPQVVQVYPYDWDTVILADALAKRTEELVEARARFNDSTLMQIAAVFQLRAEKAEAEVARLENLVGRCRPAIALLVEDGDVFVLAKVREHEALLDEIDQGRKE